MIFDHGCDAFNTLLNGMAISKLFVVSTHWQGIALVLVTSTFYFATLDQYYTHTLYLPPLNGPNEGQTLLVFLAIFGGIMGRLVGDQVEVYGRKNGTSESRTM